MGWGGIQAEVMPPNRASKKVLLNNGFMKEGTLRQANVWSGKGIVDLEVYSILKDDYISKLKVFSLRFLAEQSSSSHR